MVITLPGFDVAFGAPLTTITPNGLGTSLLQPTGGVYNITGGTTAGNNLFHSFSTFNLGTGDTADFNVSNNVTNILARVTGGASTIDGTITATIGAGGPLSSANLFLINPAGIMFTANAQVNLGGSFIVSTANYVKFSDGSYFYGDVNHPIQDGGLTSAPVSAFGFLTATPQPISFAGSQLAMQSGQGLHLIGGDITLDQGGPFEQGTNLSAPSGNLTLFSAASAGEVPFSLTSAGTGFANATNTSFGNITMQNGSKAAIDSSQGSGSIIIRGGQLVVDHSTISSANSSSNPGGSISVQADSLTVQNAGQIIASTSASGNAGNVSVTANSLTVDGTSTPASGTDNKQASSNAGVTGIFSNSNAGATGNSGSVAITVTADLDILNSGDISGGSFSAGSGGDVTVQATTLTINGSGTPGYFTGIDSESNPVATGDGGEVNITATNSLSIEGGGQIESSTWSSGDAGNVSVTANSLTVDGTDAPASGTSSNAGNSSIRVVGSNAGVTGIFSNSNAGATGNAGSVDVMTANELAILNSGDISGGTFSEGNGGDVTIQAATLTINGSGTPGYFTGIDSDANFHATGNAGQVSTTVTGNLALSGGGEISCDTFGPGNAGSATVQAESLNIGGTGSAISTNANAEPEESDNVAAAGNAGSIDVTVTGALTLTNGAVISASGAGSGNAGSIDVSVNGALTISNGAMISSASMGAGNGGSMVVQAGSLMIEGASFQYGSTGIISESIGFPTQGSAGSLMVNVLNGLSVNDGGEIASATLASGNDGPISLQAGSVAINGTTVAQSGLQNGVFADPLSTQYGITLDGSLGANEALFGPIYQITAGMGQQVGSNLFLSFGLFSPSGGDVVTVSGPANIQNILARVTGGGPSSIDGQVDSSISGANLFLLNPEGLIFGPQAQVNVTGSVAVSTANYVKFSDGGIFYAQLGDNDELSGAPVSALGFLTATPQPVSFAGTQITMQPASGLDVIAGNITIDQGSPDGVTQQPTELSAPGGALTLFSAASPGEVPFSLALPGSGFATAPFSAFGSITLQNQSYVAIDGFGGGTVFIRGGTILVDNSSIRSGNYGNVAGGNISVQGESLTLQNDGTIISSTASSGTGGAINVQANSASIDGAVGTFLGSDPNGDGIYAISASGIFSEATGPGDAGPVDVNITLALNITRGGQIGTNTTGSGNGGNIYIQAGSLSLDGVAEDSSGNPLASNDTYGPSGYFLYTTLSPSEISVQTSGPGAAGAINLSTIGSLSLTNGATISSIASGSGPGGNLTIQAGAISIDGSSGNVVNSFYNYPPFAASISPSQISTQTNGSAQGGGIDVTAASLSLTNGGAISSSATSSGDGGNIMVTAGSANIDGAGLVTFSFPEFSASPVFVFSPSAVSSQTSGTGNGGALQVTTSGALSLTNGGEIFTNNEEYLYFNTGGGAGGNATINAGSLSISGATSDPNGNPYVSQISSLSYGTGVGGTFNVTAGALTLSNGGEILTSTQYSGGPGGTVFVQASSLSIDSVAHTSGGVAVLNSQSEPIPSQISSQSDGNGDGGNLSVQVNNDLSISHSGQINSQGSSYDTAGDLEIQAGSLTIDGTGSPAGSTGIFTSIAASQTGIAYTLNLNITGATGLVAGGQIVSTTNAGVAGGSISLTTNSLNVDSSSEIATETTGSGNAGALTVNVAQALEISAGGQILTSNSGAGNGGALLVHAGSASIDGTSLHFGTTGIISESSGSGSLGTLSLNVTGELAVNDGGEIASATEGIGDNDPISLQAGSVTINDSTVSQVDLQNGVFANPLSNQYDVTLDGSLGTPQVLFGPYYTVTSAMGLVVGSNLFESFGSLSFTDSEALSFSGPAAIQNIIVRVTGNNASSMDGTLSSSIAGANLFFLNPAGVTLGSSAQLAVNGGVTLGTANYVKFSDGGIFHTSLGQQDNPTGAGVSALGFTSATPGIISITGAQLSVPAGTNFDLIGGDMSLSGVILSAPSGGLGIFSAAGTGEVPINLTSPASGFAATTVTSFGKVTLQNGSTVTINGQGGGELALVGGMVTLDGSVLSSVNSGTLAGGAISVRANELNISDGGVIGTANDNTGNGGPITITADSLNIAGPGSGIFSEVGYAYPANGNGGALSLYINGLLSVTNGGVILTDTDSGNGGSIQITAGSAIVDGTLDLGAYTPIVGPTFTTGILTQTEGDAAGSVGNLTINVGGNLTLLGAGQIDSFSNTLGPPGNISVTAGSLDIDGTATIDIPGLARTGIISANFLGSNSGSLVVNVSGQINLVNSGGIFVAQIGYASVSSGTLAVLSVTAGSLTIDSASGYGQTGIFSGDSAIFSYVPVTGGDVTVDVKGALTLINGDIDDSTYTSAPGGTVFIQAASLVVDQSDILSDASGSGNAGEVDVEIAGEAALNGGTIGTDTYSAGNAGAVNFQAGSLTMNSGSQVTSASLGGFNATGSAGTVNVSVDGALNIFGGSQVASSTTTSGNAGTITVQAGTLAIDGSSTPGSTTGITAQATAPGYGGDITVTSGNLVLSGGGTISTSSSISNAGNIQINATNLSLQSNSSITTSAGMDGGSITLNVSGQVYLLDGTIQSAANGGVGTTGGNITIDPQFVVLDNSLISANDPLGAGGNILIITNDFLNNDSPITATGTTDGTVTISAPDLDLGGSLLGLPAVLESDEKRLRESCARSINHEFSSLIVVGRGGTESAPEELQSDFGMRVPSALKMSTIPAP